jgi:transcriptional regulator with XRE-family HTH domain
MRLSEYIADREVRDPKYRSLRAQTRPAFELRRALLAARLAAGLTQEQLAERVGTKQPAIARLENGTGSPSLATLTQLAAALDVSFEITATGVMVHDRVVPARESAAVPR